MREVSVNIMIEKFQILCLTFIFVPNPWGNPYENPHLKRNPYFWRFINKTDFSPTGLSQKMWNVLFKILTKILKKNRTLKGTPALLFFFDSHNSSKWKGRHFALGFKTRVELSAVMKLFESRNSRKMKMTFTSNLGFEFTAKVCCLFYSPFLKVSIQ